MNTNIKFLEKIYLLLSIGILILIIFTPLIINSGFSIIPEEVLEVITIALLFGVGYILLTLYRWEIKKNQERCEKLNCEKSGMEEHLMDAFKHIGYVNVLIDEIRSVFSEIKKYPENKQDFKYVLQFLGSRAISITNSNWVYFRIIDSSSVSTLGEYFKSRNNTAVLPYHFSNRALLECSTINACRIIKSAQENFTVKTFCIIQSEHIAKDQEILIKALVNQLEMLFLIFSSTYYKNTGSRRITTKQNYSGPISGVEREKNIV